MAYWIQCFKYEPAIVFRKTNAYINALAVKRWNLKQYKTVKFFLCHDAVRLGLMFQKKDDDEGCRLQFYDTRNNNFPCTSAIGLYNLKGKYILHKEDAEFPVDNDYSVLLWFFISKEE